jgi:hypothetical protein
LTPILPFFYEFVNPFFGVTVFRMRKKLHVKPFSAYLRGLSISSLQWICFEYESMNMFDAPIALPGTSGPLGILSMSMALTELRRSDILFASEHSWTTRWPAHGLSRRCGKESLCIRRAGSFAESWCSWRLPPVPPPARGPRRQRSASRRRPARGLPGPCPRSPLSYLPQLHRPRAHRRRLRQERPRQPRQPQRRRL